MKKYNKKLLMLVLSLVFAFMAVFFIGCGPSAYDLAVQNGFVGSVTEWLESLRGQNAFELWQTQSGNEDKTLTDFFDSFMSADDVSLQDWFELYQQLNPNATIDSFIERFLSRPNTDDSVGAIQKMLRSSVSVRAVFNFSNFRTSTALGSGVILDINRTTGVTYIITNYHVIYEHSARERTSQNVTVAPFGREFFGGSGDSLNLSVQATVVGGSASRDIAVLRTEPNQTFRNNVYLPVEVADSNDIAVGQWAFTVGNASGAGISVTQGVVSVDSEFIQMERLDANSGLVAHRVIRTDAAINSGNSGGGMFNSNGELIGIVMAKTVSESVENMGYSVPSNVAIGVANIVMENIRQNNQFVRFTIGITTMITGSRAVLVDDIVRVQEEISVQNVTRHSPADTIVQENDIILSARLNNGGTIAINRNFMLSDFLLRARVGDELHLRVIRNLQEVNLPPITIRASSFAEI